MRRDWQAKKTHLEQKGVGTFWDADFPSDETALGSVIHRVPGTIWLRPREMFLNKPCVLRQADLRSIGGGDGQQLSANAGGPAPHPGAGPPAWCQNAGARMGRNSSVVAQELSKNINQGLLGDCWLLSAMAVLCTRPDLLEQLFLDPPFASACGAYGFRLYEVGEVKSLIVDDRIPASNMRQPVFARPHTGAQGEVVLWPLLLEKAFAKMYGSYGAIEAGQVHEALMDMTGGLGEVINLHGSNGAGANPDNLWARLCNFKRAGHLLTAGSEGSNDMHTSPRGIVQGHAYSIMQVRTLNGGVRLMKLRNPWGQGEWKGDFGTHSRAWTPELRAKLRYYGENDGVIWMPFTDFMGEFAAVYTCRVFKNEEFHRQVVQGDWSNTPKQKISLRVEGDGCVCLQLQQGDVRGTSGAGSPLRLEIKEAPMYDQNNPHMTCRPWSKNTPVTPQRQVAFDVDLRSGLYEVFAQVCGHKGGKYALIVWSPRSIRVSLSKPDENVNAVKEHCDDGFGLSAGSGPGSGSSAPPSMGFQSSATRPPMGFSNAPPMGTQPSPSPMGMGPPQPSMGSQMPQPGAQAGLPDSGPMQTADAWGAPQRADSWGTPQRADSWGTPQRADSWGTPQRADSWGTPQRADSNGRAESWDLDRLGAIPSRGPPQQQPSNRGPPSQQPWLEMTQQSMGQQQQSGFGQHLAPPSALRRPAPQNAGQIGQQNAGQPGRQNSGGQVGQQGRKQVGFSDQPRQQNSAGSDQPWRTNSAGSDHPGRQNSGGNPQVGFGPGPQQQGNWAPSSQMHDGFGMAPAPSHWGSNYGQGGAGAPPPQPSWGGAQAHVQPHWGAAPPASSTPFSPAPMPAAPGSSAPWTPASQMDFGPSPHWGGGRGGAQPGFAQAIPEQGIASGAGALDQNFGMNNKYFASQQREDFGSQMNFY